MMQMLRLPLILVALLLFCTACSEPSVSFELRIQPEFVTLNYEAETRLELSVLRDNLPADAPILVELVDPPPGFAAAPVTIVGRSATFTITAQSGATLGTYILSLRASSPDVSVQEIVTFEAAVTL